MPKSPEPDNSDKPPGGQDPTFKITEGYLKGFANKELQSFIDTRESPVITEILHYAPNGTGVLTEHYDLVRPGNPQVMDDVEILRKAHDRFSQNLQLAVRGLYRIASQMQDGLLDVDQVLTNGEGDAELTADEMVLVIGDVWKPPSEEPVGFTINEDGGIDLDQGDDDPDKGDDDPDKGDDPGT